MADEGKVSRSKTLPTEQEMLARDVMRNVEQVARRLESTAAAIRSEAKWLQTRGARPGAYAELAATVVKEITVGLFNMPLHGLVIAAGRADGAAHNGHYGVPDCPGSGDVFRPYPCGRDEDHAPHPLGRPPAPRNPDYGVPGETECDVFQGLQCTPKREQCQTFCIRNGPPARNPCPPGCDRPVKHGFTGHVDEPHRSPDYGATDDHVFVGDRDGCSVVPVGRLSRCGLPASEHRAPGNGCPTCGDEYPPVARKLSGNEVVCIDLWHLGAVGDQQLDGSQ